MKLDLDAKCPTCEGTGKNKETQKSCEQCGGSGVFPTETS